MTLRTAALIAGALGVVLLAVGLISQAIKPAAEARPSAALTTSVVEFPPEVLALASAGKVTVTGDGELVAHVARTVDAAAWLASRDVSVITGITDWELLSTRLASPAPTASPSPSPSPSTSTKPSTSPSPSASPSPAPSTAPVSAGSQDTWRATETASGTYTVDVATLPAGLTLVVDSPSGANLTRAQMELSRVINDSWMKQLTWWGVGLTGLGLIALILLFIDMRPVQTKGESWLAYRSGIGSGKRDPRPGSRRARRQSGVSMPVAELGDAESGDAESGDAEVEPTFGADSPDAPEDGEERS